MPISSTLGVVGLHVLFQYIAEVVSGVALSPGEELARTAAETAPLRDLLRSARWF